MDDKHDSEKRDEAASDLSRRDFIAMSVAAVILKTTGSASAPIPLDQKDI
jgi:hypothetical protein